MWVKDEISAVQSYNRAPESWKETRWSRLRYSLTVLTFEAFFFLGDDPQGRLKDFSSNAN